MADLLLYPHRNTMATVGGGPAGRWMMTRQVRILVIILSGTVIRRQDRRQCHYYPQLLLRQARKPGEISSLLLIFLYHLDIVKTSSKYQAGIKGYKVSESLLID